MRAVDLAVYADTLAARSSTIASQVERARARLREAAIEHEARRALGEQVVARLQPLGLFADLDAAEHGRYVQELTESLRALEQLQVWVEARLALLGREDARGREERAA